MARGSRRGRGGANRPNQAARPGRGRRGRGAQADRLPTAQAGAANVPANASIRGNVQMPTRAGPGGAVPAGRRSSPTGAERQDRRARAAAAMHDFHYVRGDLKWVAITTVTAVALVLALWVAISL